MKNKKPTKENKSTRVIRFVRFLQNYADRPWYPVLIGFLAGLDNLILIIPNDGILISSTMLTPKKWLSLALNVTVGSTIGALTLALLIKAYGIALILAVDPSIVQSTTWVYTSEFFGKYGLYLVFLIAVTPLAQQPAVILSTLAGTSLTELVVVVFIGRLIKFLIMSYVASHAPKLLKKMWGLKGELEEVGQPVEKL